MVGFGQQHDQRGDGAIGLEHADRARIDQPGVIVEHRAGRLADALDIDRISGVDDRLDRRAVAGLRRADHGSGNSIASPS